MRFAEINLLGVYVAPIAPMIVLAWIVLIPLRHFVDRFGLLNHVWHPMLVVFSVYVIVLAALTLLAGLLGL
jgi:hypothetical protein